MRKELTINAQTPNEEMVKYKIAYVSTTATETQLFNFATALNNLTTNDLVSVELTTVEEITGE